MSASSKGRVLHHGTTRQRAGGPFPVGSPAEYAQGKAANFPAEGGPAILEIEVPEEIVQWASDAGGEIRFELGHGLEELLKAWPTIPKRIL